MTQHYHIFTVDFRPNIELRLSTESMTYTSIPMEQTRDQFYTTFIAIRNKVTGKTRLVEANEVVLKPEVVYPKSTNPVLLQDSSHENKTLAEKIEASKHLIKSFGQAKGQRFYDQQERMKVDSTQVEDKVLKAAGVVAEDKLAAAPKVEEVAIIPKRNNEARRTDQVYKVEDQLTQTELKQLRDKAEITLQDWSTEEDVKKAQKDRVLSPLGVELFMKFLNSSGELGDRVALTLYMEGIIKFTKLRQGELKTGEKKLQDFLPVSIKKKIFGVFTQLSGHNNRNITPELKDRSDHLLSSLIRTLISSLQGHLPRYCPLSSHQQL